MSRHGDRRIGRGLTARGLWQRRWLSLLVFLVAGVAAAAAAMGPMYADAARTAIARDAFTDAAPDAQGLMVTFFARLTPPGDLGEVLPATGLPHAFRDPVRGAETTTPVFGEIDRVKVIWRDGACERLRLVAGRCPQGAREVVASAATSERYGWRVGGEALLDVFIPPEPAQASSDGELARPEPTPLEVVGIYEPRDPSEPYWFGLPYFPDTTGKAELVAASGHLFDPLFTHEATLEWARPVDAPWTFSVTLFVDPDRLTGEDAAALDAVPGRLRDSVAASALGPAVVITRMGAITAEALRDQSALAVPVALVSLELVALCWLVLFLGVADLARARSGEIGLARLRGLAPLQVWRFALSEPVVLLVAALPAGVAGGWFLTASLSGALLGPDIPVTVGWVAWVAAGGAVAGGLLAAALAARTTVTTRVTEQWRRSRTHAQRRSWVPDAIVLALVTAGLVELTAAGVVTDPSRQRATALLVPALLAVGVALLAARVLPWACQAAFGVTRRRGGLGAFLALRRIGRAPGTANTVIVLTAAFALATFAVATWTTTARNHREVARTHNGADTVLTVALPTGVTLPDLVEGADPGDRLAAGVAVRDRGSRLLAVDTDRFAHVAYWRPHFADQPLDELLAELPSPTAPPVMLSGDAIRVTVDADDVPDPEFDLFVDLHLPDEIGRTRLTADRNPSDPQVFVRTLSRSCLDVCELRGLRVRAAAQRPQGEEAQLVIRELEVHSDGTWRTVDAGLADTSRWWAESRPDHGPAEWTGTPQGLELTFQTGTDTRLVVATHPPALPAITVGRIAPQPGGTQVYGLDGSAQPIDSVIELRAAPGATGRTGVVDYSIAASAAYGISPQTEHEVWVAPGATAQISQALEAQGATVTAVRTVEDLIRRFNRQGPGLAIVMLVASAIAAAALALARAILGLYATGRRRTHELAALAAVGVRRGTLRAALLIEQAATLGVGVLAGVLAGTAAAVIALPTVPQFSTPPTTPPLSYALDPLLLGGVAATAALAVAVAAVLTSEAIRRSAQVDQLREARP